MQAREITLENECGGIQNHAMQMMTITDRLNLDGEYHQCCNDDQGKGEY